MCDNYVSCSLNHFITIWNMPVPSGKKKSIDWSNNSVNNLNYCNLQTIVSITNN